MSHPVRVWDLPTRLFHWSLAATTVALVVTAKLGGNAMQWHLRLGYVMLTLLLFRLVWGLIGGHWSRFANFVPTPARLARHLTGKEYEDPQQVADAQRLGHSPLGALSVLGMLAALVAQLVSGLMSDDEIAFAGSLSRFVSGEWVGQATWFHKDVGQYLLIGLVVLHLLAITFYVLVRRQPLVRAILYGDKHLTEGSTHATASRDDAASRTLATLVVTLCGLVAWWVARLGAF